MLSFILKYTHETKQSTKQVNPSSKRANTSEETASALNLRASASAHIGRVQMPPGNSSRAHHQCSKYKVEIKNVLNEENMIQLTTLKRKFQCFWKRESAKTHHGNCRRPTEMKRRKIFVTDTNWDCWQKRRRGMRKSRDLQKMHCGHNHRKN